MDSVRVARKGWLIAALSVLLPGLGHWYIGKRDRAVFVASSFLFHITLAYTLLHMVVIEQPVSIVYLLLVIPYHYFYAIFNSLQTRNDRFHYRSPLQLALAIPLLFIALALMLPINALYPFKQVVNQYYPFAVLLCSAMYLLWHLKKRSNGKLYLLRVSSSLSLLLFLLLLLLQQNIPIQWKNWLLALPLLLLVELLLIFLLRYKKGASLGYSFDGWSLIVASCFIASGYVVTQYSDYPAELLESFHAPAIADTQLDSEHGFHYELPPVKVSTSQGYQYLQLRHLNGYVSISSGEVDEITIFPELYVTTDNEEQAQSVKEQSSIDVSFNDKLTITTTLPNYQLNQYPRMNLRLVIPKQDRFFKGLDVRVEHGAISVKQLILSHELKLESNSASIHVDSTIGNIQANSKSGSIFVRKAAGDIDVQTKKGDITIIHPTRSISASSLNGDINVRAERQYGNWSLNATVGNIQVVLPKQVDFLLNAKVSFGYISTPFLQRIEDAKQLSVEHSLPDEQSLQYEEGLQEEAGLQSEAGAGLQEEAGLQNGAGPQIERGLLFKKPSRDERLKQLEYRAGAERYTIDLYASHYILIQ